MLHSIADRRRRRGLRWPRKRAEIVESIWGHEAALPDRATPDAVLPTNVSNLSAVVWALGKPAPAAPFLYSTVHHLKRGGKRAFLLHHGHSKGPGGNAGRRRGLVASGPPPSRRRRGRDADRPSGLASTRRPRDAGRPSSRYNTGPSPRCTGTEPGSSWWDRYNMSGFLGDLADADVFILSMPLFGVNQVDGYPEAHAVFQEWEEEGAFPIRVAAAATPFPHAGNNKQGPGQAIRLNSSSTLKYFVEPVVLTINYALSLGYEEVHLTGKSGGGWTTTLAAAIDPRIQVSIPDAGSIPIEFNHTSWDYEQWPIREIYQRCDYECMYALAAQEPGRLSLQLLHEDDPCCFAGHGRHDEILNYNDAVRGTLATGGGWFSTAIANWTEHEYSPRDRVIIAGAWNAWAAGANRSAYDALACDILRAPEVECDA